MTSMTIYTLGIEVITQYDQNVCHDLGPKYNSIKNYSF